MKTLYFIGNKILISIIVVFLIIQIFGCSSNRGLVRFNTLKYPTSMSAFLFDQDETVIMKGKGLESLYSFKHAKTFWNLAYGLIPLNQAEEGISNYLNSIVEEYNGDGIINLTLTIEQGASNKIYSFLMYLPSLIPIFPSSVRITVTGEVVKLNKYEITEINNDEIRRNFITPKSVQSIINEEIANKDK
jgi:hypothetical protein